MRILVSLVAAFTLAVFSLSVGGVSALSEDPADAPSEAPADPAGEDRAFEDGEMGKIDGCEGEIYSTHEAAAEAAEAKGTSFHEHQEAGTTYYMLG
ncbi:MAG: hypothetical protein VX287_01905 [Actinomycetota bacterium]|nr:hypothetical protein [Actinomycetota bacterium]